MAAQTSDHTAFDLLDPAIQHYIWQQNWTELRDIQGQAIPLILKADRDVILAAPTASGKTEAAFFPALSHLRQSPQPRLIVYISPLKALINDQFGRLELLCAELNIEVWPWHGDSSASRKQKFLAAPQGVLLITPESLEAMLCLRGTAVGKIFAATEFFVIDELHAFIGSVRGKQLQSLLHRIETVVGRLVPRLGLSATLGDMHLAAEFIRPGQGEQVALLTSEDEQTDIKLLVKGFLEPVPPPVPPPLAMDAEKTAQGEELEPITPRQIAKHLFHTLRGSHNLIFPNSRREVERYTYILNKLCDEKNLPKEFWPHHGNLSKEIRTDSEFALKQTDRPATAICTNTLELGIDIGRVRAIAQIGVPPSVASLRQRLGRSGRRGEAAILYGYTIEEEMTPNTSLATELRLNTVQITAMILLLSERWVEAPRAKNLHISTLVQQILSLIAQYGGATPPQLFSLLCAPRTPFNAVSQAVFLGLLRQLGSKDLIVQDPSGLILLGGLGEKMVNHYSFYAAFASEEEFRIVSGSKNLGSLPVSQLVTIGQMIIFGGKTWRVDEIDDAKKILYVSPSKTAIPPIFNSGGGRVHTRVRQKMRQILATDGVPGFLDATAQRFLAEGREAYRRGNFANKLTRDQGRETLILTWLGDDANEAILCLLASRGVQAALAGPFIAVQKSQELAEDGLIQLLSTIASAPQPPTSQLLADAKNLQREKWDWAASREGLEISYASQFLDLDEAYQWLHSQMKISRI
ncbi:MAG: DEAD/DEAH box helicase [Alphaproteobacteria bacterium]|nr:DEAD/DEAH box helicase [Alphaproteobacteria bacterium]